MLPELVDDLVATLGGDLVGAYLYGSAVSGDFDPALSDLDVVVVTQTDVDALGFGGVAGVIDRLAAREPDWAHRLDITIVGRRTLTGFRGGGPFLEVSHEDPLQLIDRAEDWLETWYLAGTAEAPLIGPPASSIFPPIETAEFLVAISGDIHSFVGAVADDWTHGRVAYRALTVCRVLRSLDSGALCSKVQGAAWVAARFPAWAGLIDAALAVRAADGARDFTQSERAEAGRFLAFMADQIRPAS